MPQEKLYTVRQELARRLKIYWRVYHKRPESYNATLGLGRPPKSQDRGFTGFSISGQRFVRGVPA